MRVCVFDSINRSRAKGSFPSLNSACDVLEVGTQSVACFVLRQIAALAASIQIYLWRALQYNTKLVNLEPKQSSCYIYQYEFHCKNKTKQNAKWTFAQEKNLQSALIFEIKDVGQNHCYNFTTMNEFRAFFRTSRLLHQ